MEIKHKYRRLGRQIPKYRIGGTIVGGVGHDENNMIGDKGVPVVLSAGYLATGGKYIPQDKHAEIESEELIITRETADKMDQLIEEYDSCECPGKLILLGQLIKQALKATSDETCRTKCVYKPLLNKIK